MAARKKPAPADTAAETITIEAPAAGTDLATLTPDQRAELVLSFESTRIKLQELAKASTTLTTVDTPDNMAAAKAARAKLQATRVLIEKTGKAARDETTKFNKAVIAKERELIEEISPEEDRLAQLILTEQRRQEEAERVAREEEQARAEAITKAFARVRSLPGLAVVATVDVIDELISEAQQLLNDQSHLPGDMRPAARYEANLAINELKAARDRRVQADKDAAELAAFRAQQATQAAQAASTAPTTPPSTAQAERAHSGPAIDDDLPPPVNVRQQPVAAAVWTVIASSPNVTLPRRAIDNVLQLLHSIGYGDHLDVVNLEEALDDADVPGGANG